jgi:S-disulfanyl-L-cysteine oxidoreductase SoxD
MKLTILSTFFFATIAATAFADPVSEQADRGAKLFGAKCAKCHGDSGEGGKKAPPVVGKTALPLDPPATAKGRKVQFRTAADVYSWVKANMPPKESERLTDAEYVEVLAFDLKANGVVLTKPLDLESAQKLILHP